MLNLSTFSVQLLFLSDCMNPRLEMMVESFVALVDLLGSKEDRFVVSGIGAWFCDLAASGRGCEFTQPRAHAGALCIF